MLDIRTLAQIVRRPHPEQANCLDAVARLFSSWHRLAHRSDSLTLGDTAARRSTLALLTYLAR
jgi:hypothetical protein